MTAEAADSPHAQLRSSCLPDVSPASSAASLTASLSASQNALSSPGGSVHVASSPAGSLRKQVGEQLISLPEEHQVLGFEAPGNGAAPAAAAAEGGRTQGARGVTEPGEDAAGAPVPLPRSSLQGSWEKSSARRSVRIAEPSESPSAATDGGGGGGGGSARGSRRNMRRRSTGEADVEAMLMARSSDQLLIDHPSDRRPSRLLVPDVDTLLPHQTHPTHDASPGSAHPLSPFERLLQARSGLASLRQRRSSSQPQQPILASSLHGEPQDPDEIARRQAIISHLLQPRASLPLSRSNLTVERRTSSIMSPDSRHQSASAAAGAKLHAINTSKVSESASSSALERARAQQAAKHESSGHPVPDHAGVDCSTSVCSTPTEALSMQGEQLGFVVGLQDAGASGGNPLGVKASNSRSSKKSQGQASSRTFPADAASGRRRSNLFDVLPDLLPLLDGDQGIQSHPKALLHQNRELRQDLEMTLQANEKLKAQLEHGTKQLRQAQEEVQALRRAQQQQLGGGGGLLACLPFLGRKASVHTDAPPPKV